MKAWSLYTLDGLIKHANENATQLPDGRWVPARPERYSSIWNDLKLAWMVFRREADAFVWPGGQ